MATRIPTLAAAHLALALASGLAVGDKVKVLRPFKKGELGTDLDYDKDMDDSIGEELEITGIYNNGTHFEVEDTYEWPFFCLQKINDPLCVRDINGDGDDADIAMDGSRVEVGCNTITFEKVEAVYQAMVAQRAKVAPKATPARRRR